MNILLINHYAGSSSLGMEYRPYFMAKEWIKKGHQVTIVASSFSHVRSIQPKVKKNFDIENIEGINYCWLKTISYEGNSIKRFVNILEFVLKLCLNKKRIVKNFRPDVVIASSTYPLDIYPAENISKMTGAKLIYEIHDLWPLSPMEIGGYSKYHPFIMLMQRAENRCYKKCDKIVSILPKTKEHCISHGMAAEKWEYVPNGISLVEFENQIPIPELQKKQIESLRQKHKYLFGYAGSIGLANALNAFVHSAAKFNDNEIAFVIIGKGPEKDDLLKLKNEHRLNNVFFIDPVPKNAILTILAYFDFLYLGLKKQNLFRFGISPNKLFDYMYAGKPIIQAIEAGNDIVADAKCGFTIEPENPDAIVDAVKKLIDLSSNEKIQMGENGKEYVLKNHEYSVIVENYIKALDLKAKE